MIFREIGSKEESQVIGVVDASYRYGEKSVGGIILIIADESLKFLERFLHKMKQRQSKRWIN